MDADARLDSDPSRGIDGDVNQPAAGWMIERSVEVERRTSRIEDGGDDPLLPGRSSVWLT